MDIKDENEPTAKRKRTVATIEDDIVVVNGIHFCIVCGFVPCQCTDDKIDCNDRKYSDDSTTVTSTSFFPLDHLPDHVLLIVLANLSIGQLAGYSMLSRRFYRLAYAKSLWHRVHVNTNEIAIRNDRRRTSNKLFGRMLEKMSPAIKRIDISYDEYNTRTKCSIALSQLFQYCIQANVYLRYNANDRSRLGGYVSSPQLLLFGAKTHAELHYLTGCLPNLRSLDVIWQTQFGIIRYNDFFHQLISHITNANVFPQLHNFSLQSQPPHRPATVTTSGIVNILRCEKRHFRSVGSQLIEENDILHTYVKHQHRSITTLDIIDCRLGDRDVHALIACTQLRELSMRCGAMSDVAIEYVKEVLRQFFHSQKQGCVLNNFTVACLLVDKSRAMKPLSDWHLSTAKVENKMHTINHLHLSDAANFTESSVCSLFNPKDGMRQLKYLRLLAFSSLNDRCIDSITRCCLDLESLSIALCASISEQSVLMIAQRLSHCRLLSLAGSILDQRHRLNRVLLLQSSGVFLKSLQLFDYHDMSDELINDTTAIELIKRKHNLIVINHDGRVIDWQNVIDASLSNHHHNRRWWNNDRISHIREHITGGCCLYFD